MPLYLGNEKIGGLAVKTIIQSASLPELTNPAEASDILEGQEAINASGTKIVGTIESKSSSDLTVNGATVAVPSGYYPSQVSKSVATADQATPNIAVDSNGLVTASTTQSAGYVEYGTKTATKQLTTQGTKTITPTKSEQTAVASNIYTTGDIKVGAIPNEYITTTDATASADEVFQGETVYVNGSKVTGSFTIDEELTSQTTLLTNLKTALEGKATGSEVTLPELTTPATSAQILSGYEAIDGEGNKITGTIENAVMDKDDMYVDPSTGVVTATIGFTEGGYLDGYQEFTTINQLPTQAETHWYITPDDGTVTMVSAGTYCTGDIMVNAESSGSDNTFPYTITVNSNYEVDWYYAYNASKGYLSVFILPYQGYSCTVDSVDGVWVYTNDTLNALRVISCICSDNITINVTYNISSGGEESPYSLRQIEEDN